MGGKYVIWERVVDLVNNSSIRGRRADRTLRMIRHPDCSMVSSLVVFLVAETSEDIPDARPRTAM